MNAVAPTPAFPHSPSVRLHSLDHLRAVAMFLGIVVHAAIPFITVSGADAWPARNSQQSTGFDLIAGVIHAFRMQLFFLLSGFFARLVFNRSGPSGFLKHRLLRLGVPFALGMLTLVPIIQWQSGFTFNPDATAHLWFLEYLLIYSVAAVALARWQPPATLDRLTRRILASPWKPLLLTLPTALLMLWSPIWDEHENARGVTFLPNPLALAYFSLFYLVGWAIHRHQDLLPAFRRGAVWQALAGLTALILWGLVFQSQSPVKSGVLYNFVGSSIAWFLSFSMIALFLRHLDTPSPWGRYLSDAAYWVYLAHLPLVIALQQWIVPMPWNAWIKFLLINTLALPILLLSYQWGVRYTLIGAVLHGRKTRASAS